LLLDRSPPGIAGASFGNVGHVAAELVEPLPSFKLLFNFWRLLTRFGGPLDIPADRVFGMLPWIARFARAAFQRAGHTRALAPLVLPSAPLWEHWLKEIGRPALLRRHGHYEVGFRPNSAVLQRTRSEAMAQLGINTQPVPAAQLQALKISAGAAQVSGLWFPDSAHVIDPLEAVQAFAQAALDRGAEFRLLNVRSLALRGRHVDILSERPPITVCAVVVCAGMGSKDLLAPLGLRAPLQPVRGYHIEILDGTPFIDAPVVYTDQHVLVTPMAGRLRASTYMEFAAEDAPADSHKVDTLKRKVRSLGYTRESKSDSWVGARPILPDYLPGIGRAPDAPLFYAVGHQHIGLTLAPMTGDLMADLVADRAPRLPIEAFDLRRFGVRKQLISPRGVDCDAGTL
jgi:D-amino-acid dehydrogenase